MRYVSRFLWLVPLALHISYAVVTRAHMPDKFGGTDSLEVNRFLIQWFSIICAANIAFVFMSIWMPRFKDKSLSVPQKDYWLSTPDLRSELVERLRGIFDVSLLGINVFFLAIYQHIYQSAALRPFIAFEQNTLFFFFMGLPLVVMVFICVMTLRRLSVDARHSQEQDLE